MTAKRAVQWPEVLAAIQRTEIRKTVLDQFRSGGFNAESWRLRSAREAMAGLLTRAEDRVELEHPGWARDRVALRTVRRRLELELFP